MKRAKSCDEDGDASAAAATTMASGTTVVAIPGQRSVFSQAIMSNLATMISDAASDPAMQIPTRIVSVFNYRAHSGKTTSVIELAQRFYEDGRKVVVVDLDEQCDLSYRLLKDKMQAGECWNAFIKRMGFETVDARENRKVYPIQTSESGAYIKLGVGSLFSSMSNSVTTAMVTGKLHVMEHIYKTVLHYYLFIMDVKEDADVVLVDMSSNLSKMNMVMLAMSDFWIVPTPSDIFAVDAMRRMKKIFKSQKDEDDPCNVALQLATSIAFRHDVRVSKPSPKLIGCLVHGDRPNGLVETIGNTFASILHPLTWKTEATMAIFGTQKMETDVEKESEKTPEEDSPPMDETTRTMIMESQQSSQ